MAKIIISNEDIANESSQSSFTPPQPISQLYSQIPNNSVVSNTKSKTNPFVVFIIILLLLLVLILGAIAVVFCLGSLGGNSPSVMPQTIHTPNKNELYKENIKKVILLDRQYFNPVDTFDPSSSNFFENENLDHVAQLIFNYVQNAKRSINYDTLPPEFTTAYTSYLNAWNQLAQEIANHPNMNTLSYFVDTFVNGFIHGFTGNFNGIMEDLEKASNDNEWSSRLQQGLNSIQSTWSEVETAAGKYGINVNNVEQ